MEEKKVQLEQFCALKRIQKFAPEEMVELLEDGEAVDWIVGQALPEGPEEEVRELTALLAQIAAQVAPVAPAQEEVDTPAVAETEVPPGEEPLDWEELENLPLPPGVDLAQVKRLLDSPQGEMLADFSLFCQERGVSPEGGGEDMEKVLHDLHEEWLQTPRASLEGRKPAEVLAGGRLLPHKVETFRREGPKIGRNDPCPCGSGKKYKKCCGKAA